jgi:DNA mismatch endonuclease (patch repair protein)
MPENVSFEVRSRMMSGIRSKNTKPELLVRKALHAAGYRFRIHRKDLPGKPDLVLPKFRAVIFVHGCFWHGHNCPVFKWPKTREKFWREKIERTRVTDTNAREALLASGWRVGVVWECATRGAGKNIEDVTQSLSIWLQSSAKLIEVEG